MKLLHEAGSPRENSKLGAVDSTPPTQEALELSVWALGFETFAAKSLAEDDQPDSRKTNTLTLHKIGIPFDSRGLGVKILWSRRDHLIYEADKSFQLLDCSSHWGNERSIPHRIKSYALC